MAILDHMKILDYLKSNGTPQSDLSRLRMCFGLYILKIFLFYHLYCKRRSKSSGRSRLLRICRVFRFPCYHYPFDIPEIWIYLWLLCSLHLLYHSVIKFDNFRFLISLIGIISSSLPLLIYCPKLGFHNLLSGLLQDYIVFLPHFYGYYHAYQCWSCKLMPYSS